jgi:hypothetical protein
MGPEDECAVSSLKTQMKSRIHLFGMMIMDADVGAGESAGV